MTSSQKSTLAAVGVFALIAVVVLGGMTWATAASFELAKNRVNEEHFTKVQAALRQIDSDVKGIINFETSRPYTDYVDYHDCHDCDNDLFCDCGDQYARLPAANQHAGNGVGAGW